MISSSLRVPSPPFFPLGLLSSGEEGGGGTGAAGGGVTTVGRGVEGRAAVELPSELGRTGRGAAGSVAAVRRDIVGPVPAGRFGGVTGVGSISGKGYVAGVILRYIYSGANLRKSTEKSVTLRNETPKRHLFNHTRCFNHRSGMLSVGGLQVRKPELYRRKDKDFYTCRRFRRVGYRHADKEPGRVRSNRCTALAVAGRQDRDGTRFVRS